MKKLAGVLYLIFFLVTVFLVVSVPGQSRHVDSDSPLKCYQCNSFYDRGCADFFDNRTYPLIPCHPNVTKCRKIIQETFYDDHWDVRYIRQCAIEGEVGPHEGRWCKERSGGYNVRLKICQCDNKDGCNGAAKESPAILLVFFTICVFFVTANLYNT